MRSLLLLVSLAACSEYDLTAGDDVVGPGEDCDVELSTTVAVDIREECEGTDTIVVDSPWDVDVEWQYTSAGTGVIVMPAVGNLTDDNGDGVVDDSDDPDIVFTTWTGNTLVALHGDGSGVIFEATGYLGTGGVTIADVDNDGEPEIIAASSSNEVVAVDAEGNREWTSAYFGLSMYPQPAVADLDGDGDVEVVFDVAVVDGGSGATVATLSGITTSWRTPVLADVDQDGTQEIILGERVFDPSGTLLWTAGSGGSGNFAAVAEIDGDDGGEVLFVTGSELRIHDDDGTHIRTVTIPGTNPGPPCVADFDGDGDIEVGIPANYQISVYEIDGTQVWSQPMADGSGLAGCSGYDVNGDGAYEVLFADEQNFRIYDGSSGTVLYTDDRHNSGTVWEYPVIADVDNDGSAEVVIASNGGTWQGITVFGHAGSGWPKSGPTWGTHDFAVTNLLPDGGVPSPPAASWLVHNTFRARPAVDLPGAANLRIEGTDLCVAGCDEGAARVAYQVQNDGSVDAPAGALATLSVVEGGVTTILDTHILPEVPAGRALDGDEFVLAGWEIGGGYVLTVDASDQIRECFEDDNSWVSTETVCEE